jgi:hypothetical protein
MKRRQAMILGLALVALAGCATKPAMNEVEVENIAVKLAGETQKGQYRLVTAEPLKGWLDACKPMLIVDTMPVSRRSSLVGASSFGSACALTRIDFPYWITFDTARRMYQRKSN